MNRSALCGLLLLLLLFAQNLFAQAYPEFKVYKIEIAPDLVALVNEEPLKDYLISGGRDDGLKVDQVLDVYREIRLFDEASQRMHTLRVRVGELQVFQLEAQTAVCRLLSLTDNSNSPVLEYRVVMVGDLAVSRTQDEVKPKEPEIEEPETFEQPPLPAEAEKLVLPSELLFARNEWALKVEGEAALFSVRERFDELGQPDMIVEGHTSSRGAAEYNMELSRRRATEVADYLIMRLGIPADKVSIEYYGERYPIASNASEAGRASNRRVVIRFLAKK